MNDAERDALRAAVELLHGGSPTFRTAERVGTTLERSNLSWDVAVFDLHPPATATVCYAWSDPRPAEHAVHHRVLLHGGAVRSPESAVRSFYMVDGPSQREPRLRDID
jgi:hypothetical protein